MQKAKFRVRKITENLNKKIETIFKDLSPSKSPNPFGLHRYISSNFKGIDIPAFKLSQKIKKCGRATQQVPNSIPPKQKLILKKV